MNSQLTLLQTLMISSYTYWQFWRDLKVDIPLCIILLSQNETSNFDSYVAYCIYLDLHLQLKQKWCVHFRVVSWFSPNHKIQKKSLGIQGKKLIYLPQHSSTISIILYIYKTAEGRFIGGNGLLDYLCISIQFHLNPEVNSVSVCTAVTTSVYTYLITKSVLPLLCLLIVCFVSIMLDTGNGYQFGTWQSFKQSQSSISSVMYLKNSRYL